MLAFCLSDESSDFFFKGGMFCTALGNLVGLMSRATKTSMCLSVGRLCVLRPLPARDTDLPR